VKGRKGEVSIPTGKDSINGNLEVPAGAKAIVLFAHGSGSSRFSPRNTYVSRLMNKRGIATLLVDLLTANEEEIDEQTAQYRFNINLLANRLIDATMWLRLNPETRSLAIGYFGASTGAAAALIAAVKLSNYVKAVVSRGGRPDLAAKHLAEVKAPTLLVVGGDDFEVLEMNKEALKLIVVEKKLEVVPGATHLFEEPGTLQEAAELAIDWFVRHLCP